VRADEIAGSLYEHAKHRGQEHSVRDLKLATA
jgi:L-ornithine N5-oxygenase